MTKPRQKPAPATTHTPQYGSDLLVDLMHASEIKHLPMNPGASFKGIHDSLVNYAGYPPMIMCLHEEIAVAMAHGYAKATGEAGAAFVHSIVGLQHASMAIYHAWLDREAVIVLGSTGPMDTTKRRPWIEWIHTAVPQAALIRDYVKWDEQPHSIHAVPEAWWKAMRIARTEPRGPVYLCFDSELQEEPLPPNVTTGTGYFSASGPTRVGPDPAAVELLADRLVEAKAPVLMVDLLGQDPLAVDPFIRLAELTGASVIDKRSRFNLPTDHPANVTEAAHEVLANADVIIAFEMKDLAGALGHPPTPSNAWMAHVGLQPFIGKSWIQETQAEPPKHVRMLGDGRLVLEQIVQQIDGRVDRSAAAHRARNVAKVHDALRSKWREAQDKHWDDRPISVERLIVETRQALAGHDTVVPLDTTRGKLFRHWPLQRPGQFLGAISAGPGFGIGISLGVALAHKESNKIPVAFQPDGELLYNPGALWTAAHDRLPLLIVMFNNRSYYNDEEHQERVAVTRDRPQENKWVGMRLDDPPVDFAAMARSFGVHALGPVEDPGDLPHVLSDAVAHVAEKRLPVLVDVVTQAR